jgi:UDP-N-acetylglucosamine--N-acetylmuramyl-(pentapeptide) pyrophosphoryl-undecaprenol N-acetylglucosamine transferase
MEALYSAADVVICRAGASTLAELTYYGVCPILIPHPQASGHQKENAYYLEKKGAAFVFLQENFSFDIFKNTVEKVICDAKVKNNIKKNLTSLKLGVPYEEFCSAGCF